MKAIYTTTHVLKKGVTLIKTKKAKQMMAPIDIHLCLILLLYQLGQLIRVQPLRNDNTN